MAKITTPKPRTSRRTTAAAAPTTTPSDAAFIALAERVDRLEAQVKDLQQALHRVAEAGIPAEIVAEIASLLVSR